MLFEIEQLKNGRNKEEEEEQEQEQEEENKGCLAQTLQRPPTSTQQPLSCSSLMSFGSTYPYMLTCLSSLWEQAPL